MFYLYLINIFLYVIIYKRVTLYTYLLFVIEEQALGLCTGGWRLEEFWLSVNYYLAFVDVVLTCSVAFMELI